MITLREVDADNFTAISDLRVTEEQKDFVGSADWILALAYAHRRRNAHAMAVMLGDKPIGVVMTSEFASRSGAGFYYIDQFFIDAAYQQRGYGRQALILVLAWLSQEHHFDRIRLDVDQSATAAIRLYKSLGFAQSGYADSSHPELLFLELLIDEK